MDKGRQVCPELDTAFLQTVCLQSGSACPVRAGVQSGQLPAAVCTAQVGEPLVTAKPAGKTGQNRCEGSKLRKVCPFPDRGSRCASKSFQTHPVANQ